MRTTFAHWVGRGGLALALAGLWGCSPGESEEVATQETTACSPTPTCHAEVVGQVLTQHIEVCEPSGPGGRISMTVSRTLDFRAPGFNSFAESGTLRAGNCSEIFSYNITNAEGKATHTTVHWGPHVRGADSATFDLANNLVSGNIDGRVFTPFPPDADPASVTFEDGGPSPVLSSSRSLQKAIQRLRAKAEAAIASCNGPTIESLAAMGSISADSGGTASNEQGELAVSTSDGTQPPNRVQDLGHFTDTYGATSCNVCKYGFYAGGAAAGAACAIACAATLGIGCGACIVAAVAAVEAGILLCETSNACCPVACGSGVGSTCCAGNEACLNGAGLCCSPGTVTCAAKACCNAEQSCIAAGPNKGLCCPDASVCGPSCCQDSEICQSFGNGQCCLPGSTCGTACCMRDPLGLPPGTIQVATVCADPTRSLCCRPGDVACDGVCCGGNFECRNNECVLKPVVECGPGGVPCVDASGQRDHNVCLPLGFHFCGLNGCCGRFIP